MLITDQQVAQFHESGYFVTEPMFGEQQLDAVSAEFDRLWAEHVRQVENLDRGRYLARARYTRRNTS